MQWNIDCRIASSASGPDATLPPPGRTHVLRMLAQGLALPARIPCNTARCMRTPDRQRHVSAPTPSLARRLLIGV